ncbi:extracellular protein [Desulfurobacterium pacificum]|uniref:Extracellular protein n=1 Tax=Desulfurobacterium pacificum TaxID=240166 RepID=A0ABY1NFK6_9BACT|nr:endo alpha-1,4 polygalactosaminidase [Desulfurobacterium pacificum]SMP08342.1 extracellular protein [Desulfurobacterium pacificum]
MRFIIGLLCLTLSFLWGFQVFAQSVKPSVAFMYSEPPDQVLYTYDWIVVDPDVFTPEKIKERFYVKRRGKLIAYFSLGEVEPFRKFFKHVRKSWILGKNKAWKSFVVDLRNKECFEFMLKKASALLKSYDGIFLDTLDSYQMVLPKKEWKSYERRKVEFIKALRRNYPKKIIMVNRGFDVYPQVKSLIDAVVVESLYKGLDAKLNYVDVGNRERQWLLDKLKKIKEEKPVVVIDYLPSNKEQEARRVAKRLIKEGFIPWVADKNLTEVGEGVFHILKRKILLVYDSSLEIPDESDVHRLIQLPLEWLGYEPVVVSVGDFSEKSLTSDVKGVVVWNIRGKKNKDKVIKLLLKAKKRGIKVFIVDLSVFSPEQLKHLNFELVSNRKPEEVPKIVYKGRTYGFEIKAYPFPTDSFVNPKGKYTPLLVLENSVGQKFIPVAITPWGGYGYSGYLLKDMFNDSLWVFDPFWLFSEVFGRLPFAPDVTTESGRRIMTVHLDGDGFADKSFVEYGKYVGEVLREKIFKVYKVPHTVSVIVGEVDPRGLYPKKAKKLMEVAKSIFSLPNVEPASHTYSHPFNWIDVYRMSMGLKPTDKRNLKYGYHLPIPGYVPSVKKEIDYSLEFIDKYLAPNGKKAKVLLWSGDCAPPPPVVERTYKLGVYNVNGGDTTIDDTFPYLCKVSPMGINKGKFFQVYAPVQNEEVYTKGWKIKDGYVRVISTFKLTDKPRRLKPISIYYHFYSAQFPLSFNALKKVYDWAMRQGTVPMFLSEYAQRVLEFRGASIAESNRDGNMYFCSSGSLKTVRLEGKGGIPSIDKSQGVVGYRRINGRIYVFLDDSRCRRIVFVNRDDNDFVLVSSNGMVKDFRKDVERGYYRLVLHSEVLPLKADLRVADTCSLRVGNGVNLKRKGGMVEVEARKKKVTVEAVCKR